MSALTRFQPRFTLGNLRYHIDDTKVIDGYLECDGSTALKNAYPDLFNTVGYIKDNQTLSGTVSTSGTLDIEDVIYANGIYVYVGETSTIQTSNDAITWTSRIDGTPIYVGGKTFSRAGNTSTVSVSLTDLTGGAASAPSANDVVFVAVATGSDANRSQAVSGYTQISTQYVNGTNADTNLWIGYRAMDVTPNTTITIPSTGSISDAQTVAIQVWRNLSDFEIANVTSTTASSVASAIPNPPQITNLFENTVLLVVGAAGHETGTQTFTASYLNNFLTVGADDDNDSTIGMGSLSLTSESSYDPAAWTFSGTNAVSYSNASVTIALRTYPRLDTIAYGNNIFVAAGARGYLETSPDATIWTRRDSGTTNTINQVIFANNTFVYVGSSGTLGTSIDGTNWTIRSSGTTQNIKSITYANNSFVYITDNDNGGVIGSSSDATTWTTQKIQAELTYVGGTTGARGGTIGTVLNFSLTSLTGGVASSPSEGDVVFVAVATGAIANVALPVSGYTQIASLYADGTSHDTNLWVGYKVMGATPDTTVPIPGAGSADYGQSYAVQVWRNVNLNVFDASSTTSTITNSINVDPPAITTVSSNTVLLVIGAGAHILGTQTYSQSYLSNFLTVGRDDTYDSSIGFGSIFRETAGAYNPAAWTFTGGNPSGASNCSVTIALRKIFSNNINDFTNANNLYIVCGDSGLISTSTDALNWSIRNSGTSNNINNLIYSNIDNEFAYVGGGGIFATSSNGIAWTAATSGTANTLNAITYGDGYIYVGDGGTYGSASYYNYDPQIEFKLPSSDVYNIFVENENSYPTFTPRAYIKHE